jgi:putative membrane protein
MDAAIFPLLAGLEDFAVGLLTAQAPYEWGWRMHPMWSWSWGLVFIAFVLLVCGAILFAGMTGMHWFDGDRKRPSDSAMDILRQRFARGEIDKDEFDAKKKALSN